MVGRSESEETSTVLGRELNFTALKNPKRLFAELVFKAVFCLLNTEKLIKPH